MTNTRLFAPTAPRLGWVLALTSTAYFMVVLDSSVVLTALPRMQRDLHTDLASACSWLEFQFARGYSPISTGVRLLPFFATPMFVSPVAGALSDRIGRRPVMVVGLTLQALGFAWVAARGSLATSWIEITLALLVAGVGISMALPTVLTSVLNTVAQAEMGKASGVNYMAQRLGSVFGIAIGSAVFSACGKLGTPESVTAGFRPALWGCVTFAVLAALTSMAIASRTRVEVEKTDAEVLASA